MNGSAQRKRLFLKQRLKRESVDRLGQEILLRKARSLGFGDHELEELERVYGLTPLMEKSDDEQ